MKNFLLSIFLILMAVSSWGQYVVIGTGTSTTNGTSADPIERYYNHEHFQIVYTAAELTAAGMPAGSIITGLGFSVSESAVSLANFTISMGLTTQTLANPYISTGLSTVKNAFAYTPVVQTAGNFDMIAFDANFTWDGTSSIVVNTCTGSNPYITPYGGLRYTTATSGAVRYIRTDGSSSNCATATSTNGTNRPNIRFDYTASSACSGTPDPGNTISSANPVCSGVSFTLSLENATTGTGVTYQWQSSPDGSDPWTNIGTSTTTHIVSQSAETYYRCEVTCESNTGTSNPVQVTMNPWYNCYCIPTYSSGGGTDGMPLVTLGPLSQATAGNVSPYYYDYTSTQNAIPNLALGSTSNLSITFGSDGNQYSGAWIDLDQSGSFETTEFFTTNSNGGANGTVLISITVPPDATPGETRMRIRGGDDSQPTSNKPCGASNSNYGQAQDYLVNIVGPSSLQGYVYDFDGNPIAGATIEKVGEVSTTSNAGGDYLLTPLSAGSYQFRCSKTGYNEVLVTIDLPVNASVDHNFTLLQPQMDIVPESIFVILGPSESSVHELVITNDGNGMLGWQAGVISNLSCEYTIELIDSWGDGWNGGKIDLLVNNVVVLNDLTIIDGFGPESYTFEITSGDEITTLWTAGSYPGENRYSINNSLGTEVWFAQGSSGPPDILPGQLFAACNVPWIMLDNYSGEVDPFGGTQSISVTIDASATPPVDAPGVTYTADIQFTSPSGISPVTVPVTLVVTDGGLKGPEELTLFLVDEAEGKFILKWKYFTLRDMVFDHFVILRNGEMYATSTVSKLDIILTEPGTYCYKVYAVYENGAYSEPSNELCVTYPLAPGVPVSNWAILLGGLLMVTFSFYMIRRRI